MTLLYCKCLREDILCIGFFVIKVIVVLVAVINALGCGLIFVVGSISAVVLGRYRYVCVSNRNK